MIGADALGGRGGDGGRIILNGQDGQAPGAGGGGGAIMPLSRQAAKPDIENGLQISSLFLANQVQIVNSLVYVLGAGWEHYCVPRFPYETTWPLICMVSLGDIEPNTLLELSAVITDPDGVQVTQKEFTVPTGVVRSVARPNTLVDLRFTILKAGVFVITIVSGGFELARLPMEIKLKVE